MITNNDYDLLDQFIKYGNDEYSEMISALKALHQYKVHLSDGMVEILDKELETNINHIKENYELVEELESTTRLVRYWEYKE